MDSLTITLRLPSPPLSPNWRGHWATKAKDVRLYRELANVMARQALGRQDPPRWKAATVQATFFFPDRRRRDKDNLLASLKAAFDGLADAGVVENDAGFTHLPVGVTVDGSKSRVVLTIGAPE